MKLHEWRSAYLDTSKKSNGEHHNCYRGDIRIFELKNGKMRIIKRLRKRFKTHDEAYDWAKSTKIDLLT